MIMGKVRNYPVCKEDQSAGGRSLQEEPVFEVMNPLILNFHKIKTAGLCFPTAAKAFYHYFSLSQKLFDENPVSLKVFAFNQTLMGELMVFAIQLPKH